MAYDDTLFQLGMDLTRSSTAQEEDHYANSVEDSRKERKDSFVERDGIRFAGTHLIVDLFGARRLDDRKWLEKTLTRCVELAGADLLHIHLHHLTPFRGVSGMAILRDAQISIRTWPEDGYAALDVFAGGHTDQYRIVELLKQELRASKMQVRKHNRGEHLDRPDAARVRVSRQPVNAHRTNAPSIELPQKVRRSA